MNWLNNLRHSSAETYLHYLKRFCDFAKLNPDQLLENAKSDKPRKGQRMIIDASEIGNHCNHGWRVVFQFQDGRVQVEYDGEEQP